MYFVVFFQMHFHEPLSNPMGGGMRQTRQKRPGALNLATSGQGSALGVGQSATASPGRRGGSKGRRGQPESLRAKLYSRLPVGSTLNQGGDGEPAILAVKNAVMQRLGGMCIPEC